MKSLVFKSFHSLRHCFISKLAEKGISPLIIQSLSGHSTIAMTTRYSHIGLEAKRKALGDGDAEESTPTVKASAESKDATNAKLEAVRVLLEGRTNDPLAAALLALLGTSL